MRQTDCRRRLRHTQGCLQRLVSGSTILHWVYRAIRRESADIGIEEGALRIRSSFISRRNIIAGIAAIGSVAAMPAVGLAQRLCPSSPAARRVLHHRRRDPQHGPEGWPSAQGRHSHQGWRHRCGRAVAGAAAARAGDQSRPDDRHARPHRHALPSSGTRRCVRWPATARRTTSRRATRSDRTIGRSTTTTASCSASPR